MWEQVQQFLDGRFKNTGVRNCYFPLFITKAALTKEEDHLEGFAPEVAWVTRAGQSELHEPIAVRPTSETGMYPSMKNWIRSHRDLPMLLNQWNNVVRWEFKQTVPFLRSREFLWQEGHSAWADSASAEKEVYLRLDQYAATYEELLAVPVIKGLKSETEKFAGAKFTTTLEGFITANGRGIQAATSHHLGQNFSKMFDISFDPAEDVAGKSEGEQVHHHVWQNSYGYTTRSLGVMILTHGDNKGLVIPPLVAEYQVVVVPIVYKDSADAVLEACHSAVARLRAAGIRVIIDDRDTLTPPKKFFFHELRGVPVRLEVGPKDVAKNCCVLVRRDTGKKTFDIALDTLPETLAEMFADQQRILLERAREVLKDRITPVTEWKDFVSLLNDKKLPICAWCDTVECEKKIKLDSSEEAKNLAEDGFALTAAAKSLCIPFDQTLAGRDLPEKCFHCDNKAKSWTLFGRSY